MKKPDLLDMWDIRDGWEAESEQDEIPMEQTHSARVSIHNEDIELAQ